MASLFSLSLRHAGARFRFPRSFRVLCVGGVFAGSFRLGLYRFLGFVRLGRNVGLGDFFSLGCSRFLLGRRFLARQLGSPRRRERPELPLRLLLRLRVPDARLRVAGDVFPWVVEGTASRVGRHRRDGRGRLLGGCGLARGCYLDGRRGGTSSAASVAGCTALSASSRLSMLSLAKGLLQ